MSGAVTETRCDAANEPVTAHPFSFDEERSRRNCSAHPWRDPGRCLVRPEQRVARGDLAQQRFPLDCLHSFAGRSFDEQFLRQRAEQSRLGSRRRSPRFLRCAFHWVRAISRYTPPSWTVLACRERRLTASTARRLPCRQWRREAHGLPTRRRLSTTSATDSFSFIRISLPEALRTASNRSELETRHLQTSSRFR